jgi:zinc protease
VSGAFLSLLSAMAVAAPHAMAVPAPAVVRRVLPNGVRLVVMRDRSAPMIAARALWAGGLRLETPELAGIEHVLAGAWTGGCGPLDGAALARELAADGASMAGVAGRDTLALRAEWTRAGWEHGLDLLADCVARPWFAADAVGGARERARALLEDGAHSPTWGALDLVDHALRGRSSVSPLGAAASLERIDRALVEAHYRASYSLSAMTLAVVGDVDPARVLARAQARFAQVPRATVTAAASRPRTLPAERELYRHLSGARTAAVAIGFPAVGRVHPDRAALEVAAALLGRAPVRARLVADSDGGYLAVHRVCRPEEVPAVLAALRAELDRLRDPGASEADVHAAADRLAREREEALGRAPQAAALLALYEALGPGAQHAARQAALLRAVRVADVRAAVARHIRPEVAVVATAMPLLASPEAARRVREAARPARQLRGAPEPARKKRGRPARRRSHR